MEFKDQTELFVAYQDKWVALTDDDQVICSGSSLQEVLEEAGRNGIDDPVTAKMPDLTYEFIL